MNIQVSGQLFLLSTQNTSYGMEIYKDKLLECYWGARLTRPEDIPHGDQLPVEGGHYEEEDKKPNVLQSYPPSGGYFFDENCLKITYADGCRDTNLYYDSFRIEREADKETLVVTLKEVVYPLRVHLYYRVYAGLDVLDRWAEIEWQGDEPIQIEKAGSACCYPPVGRGWRLTHMSGRWAGEYRLERAPLTGGKVVMETRGGESGPYSCPWFALDRGAGEESGGVWAGSLQWSGNWKIAVELNRTEQVNVTLGINDFDFGWLLSKGETFKTPAASLVYSDGGFGGASRAFHEYQAEYLCPQPKAGQKRPVMFNSWEVFEFDIDVEQQMKLAELAASIGTELFVMDDGWFGARDNDRAGLGDWFPSPKKFPNGLHPLIEKVNSLGMDFGIWVEPEMVNRDSDLYRTHPDWVLSCPGKPKTEKRNQLVLNFAREDVKEFAWDFLNKLLSENNIAYLKWDMNRYLCEASWPEVPKERQREVWTRYVYNVWDLFERIEREFPHVLLENCSSGGCRMDLAMSARSDMVNTSDNSDTLDNLKIFEGYTQLFLPKTSGRPVTISPNGVNGRSLPLGYRMDFAMMQTMIIGNNLFKCSEEELAFMREKVALYKEIREVVHNGTLYRLVSAYEHPYAAYEFVAPSREEAVVFVFGQSIQFRRSVHRLYLPGLQPHTLYSVDGGAPVSGLGLCQAGIDVALMADMQSRILRIRKTEA